MWTRYRKSVYTSGKSALILGKLPNLKLARLKQAKIKLPNCENLQMFVCWGRGKFVRPNIHIFVKFRDFEELYLHQCSPNHFQTDSVSCHLLLRITRMDMAQGVGGGDFTCENNMLPSHVKISPLLWLHNKPHLSDQKLLK